MLQGKVFCDISHVSQSAIFSEAGLPSSGNNDLFDTILYFYPNDELLRQSLRSGQIPWWNPYNLCGYPFLANGQAGALYPPKMLLLLCFDTPTAHGILMILHLFASGFLMSQLGRSFSLSGLSSIFMGTAWIFSGFVTSAMELGMVEGCAAWIPALLLLTQACRSSWRAVGALSVCTALFLNQGHLQLVMGSLLLVLVYGLYLLLREPGGSRAVLRAALAAFLGIGMSLPLLVPTAFNLMSGSRSKLPQGLLTKVHQQFLGTSLPTFVFPELAGSPVTHFSFTRIPAGGTFAFWETVVFAGSLTFVLALYGMSLRGQPRFTGLLGLTILIFPATEAYSWVQKFPGFDRTFPARYLLLFHFCLVICAAFGFQSVQKGRGRWLGLLSLLVAGCGACYMYLQNQFGRIWLDQGLEFDTIRLPGPYAPHSAYEQEALSAFSATYSWSNPSFYLPMVVLLLGSVLLLTRRFHWLLLLLTTGELLFFALRWNPTVAREAVYPQTAATRFLQDNIGFDRVLGLNSFGANTLRPYKLASPSGYDSFFPRRSVMYLSELFPEGERYSGFPHVVGAWSFQPHLLNLAGVRYIVARLDVQLEGLPLVHESAVRIYENPYRSPRVFLLGKQQIIVDDQHTLDLISSGTLNPLETLVLSSEPTERIDETVKGWAKVLSWDLNEVKVQVTTENRAWLVLTDAYEPSWEARIDEQKLPIYRCFSLFRAVLVEPGQHVVVFRYRPRAQGLTSILASLSFFIALLMVWPFQASTKRQESHQGRGPSEEVDQEGTV
jgi:membrane protein YfhO